MGDTNDFDRDEFFESERTHLDVPCFGLSEGFRLLLPNQNQQSMTKILRDVKRQEHSLVNCVASVVYDAGTFVGRVEQVYAGLPVYGNKRCGAWYVRPGDNEIDEGFQRLCYFKSTDGHVNKWSFSFSRLNLHVALDATRRGGCVLVDATRRGKMFPDAFSKTVPIWCAVVNTAVALYRMDHEVDKGPGDGDSGFCHGTDLKLAPWVPAAEASQIEAKIDTWAMQLVDAGIEDFVTLAREMTKPLECVWAHPSHTSLPEISDMRQKSTVIVLASASIHGSRERRSLTLKSGEKIMFDYVAGAGDDEESWAMGLTPGSMWAHYEKILLADEDNMRTLVNTLARDARNASVKTGCEKEECYFKRISGTRIAIASHAYAMKHVEDLASPETAVMNISGRDIGCHVGCLPWKTVTSSTLTAGSVTSKHCRLVELDTTTTERATNYCWIADTTSRKHPAVEYAPCTAAFASHHLSAGREVLFIYDPGTSSITAALLLSTIITLFILDDAKLRRTSHGYQIDSAAGSIQPAVGADVFSRDVFRRYVANVTVQVPHIILRKSILKEVFNVFIR